MNIAIVSSMPGNVMNLYRALKRVDQDLKVELLEGPAQKPYDVIFLPGVGHFEEAMRRLRENKMEKFLLNQVEKSFIVGICLGMQILFEESEESISAGPVRGLGFLRGSVTKLKADVLPHVGWNQVRFLDDRFKDLDGKHFYFVHSYRVVCDESLIVATCEYEEEFPAMVLKNGVMGIQFHPEKSHLAGKILLKRVLECASSRR
ncbi:MAG: Imidazole glycerol phosphate synthase subunit HisH [Thermotoga sp. 50_1627]|uniref:imidazole glycerol phosphate synthase subunit HisH n=1 Tax=Pseudothermotoga sp. TaxID=2033661 RepID=UPI00076C1FC6|nr:MAG: Imidazole glycerol phosphate synthase subunit HisH [Thermotoga sp. 50_1627]MBC7116193.1 imidazole glycerol phosphate synthase subunit HisH [Pseudothermotoga sp.]MDK2923922.1 imidazole glycerol-phosphate synthase subunit HisH [Pseudothermotoga sp.]HBT38783.1 imidazole glycerol phosphate synthase subunit HisH [Pseudothermotoga sp.]HCO98296.1 imidazole glycerol phosphate synthase subunit HisH [Pseudothermotoga sp.]